MGADEAGAGAVLEALEAAEAAMRRGDLPAALVQARAAVAAGGGPGTRELAGGLLMFEDDIEGARRELEAAFREWKQAGELKAAALTAATLADLHTSWFGNRIAGSGWAARGRRLLDEVGPCVERGYVELAVLACEATDVRALHGAAEMALRLAREYADSDLAVRALADSGYALVLQGRMKEGFGRLDEAMAALSAGEVGNPAVACMSYCALLAACDRTGDVARAEEWTRLVAAALTEPLGNRPRGLHTHCRLVYGSVLCTAGRWDEGEAALLSAAGPDASVIHTHRAEAAIRLASLRVLQGRVDEAFQLVSQHEDRPGACEVLARIHFVRGQLDLATAVANRALRVTGGDQLRTAAITALLVEVALAQDDVSSATNQSQSLARLAEESDSDPLRAEAALAAGRVAAAQPDSAGAVAHFERGLVLLEREDRPFLRAMITLELAHALADASSHAAALDHASVAHRTLERLGATPLADRAAALLRSLGAPRRSGTKPGGIAVAGLTARERQVLSLVRQGLTNSQIGERLYISAKTAEHHLSRVLAKLGARTRAEAAAVAAAADFSAEDR